MGVDLSTMSRNMTVLERNEYALRARSAEDGRVVTVKLTAKGRRALESLRCDEEETFQRIYEAVPPATRLQIVKTLQILDECLTAANTNEAPCCAPVPTARLGRAKRPS
jgi:DNA-binding MarR family transcriptional regulator